MKNQNVSIEHYELNGNFVTVDFERGNDFLTAQIELTDLVNFVENRNLNECIYDYFQGSHIQEHFKFDAEIFTKENLREVVKNYLIEYPLISAVAIIENLETELSHAA